MTKKFQAQIFFLNNNYKIKTLMKIFYFITLFFASNLSKLIDKDLMK
jgi:hypothetical protein